MATNQTVPEAFASAYQRKLAHRESLRVKVVREALAAAADAEPVGSSARYHLLMAVKHTSDETLAKLGRLLK